jgi:hypothetical protein
MQDFDELLLGSGHKGNGNGKDNGKGLGSPSLSNTKEEASPSRTKEVVIESFKTPSEKFSVERSRQRQAATVSDHGLEAKMKGEVLKLRGMIEDLDNDNWSLKRELQSRDRHIVSLQQRVSALEQALGEKEHSEWRLQESLAAKEKEFMIVARAKNSLERELDSMQLQVRHQGDQLRALQHQGQRQGQGHGQGQGYGYGQEQGQEQRLDMNHGEGKDRLDSVKEEGEGSERSAGSGGSPGSQGSHGSRGSRGSRESQSGKSSRVSYRLRDLEMFSGEGKAVSKTLSTFLDKVELHAAHEERGRERNDSELVRAVCLKLKDVAFTSMQSHFNKDRSWQEFKDLLIRRFGNPHKKDLAWRELRELRMANHSATAFAAFGDRFQDLVCDISDSEKEQPSLIREFRDGLSSGLRERVDMVKNHELFTSLSEIIAAAQMAAASLFYDQHKTAMASGKDRYNGSRDTRLGSSSTTVALHATRVATSKTEAQVALDKLSRDDKGRVLHSLTREEWAELCRRDRACYSCGGGEHVMARCKQQLRHVFKHGGSGN